MLHAARRTLMVLSTLALAACGGGDDAAETEATAEPGAAAPAAESGPAATSAAPATQAAPAPATPSVLTMGDVERAGFKRGEEKNFMSVGAVDGGGGTMGGGKVEVYIYESDVPAERLTEFRQMAIPTFGWSGLCHVRNVLMLYANEAACQALRELE